MYRRQYPKKAHKKTVNERIRLFSKLNFKESIYFNRIKSPFKEILVHRTNEETPDTLSYLKHFLKRTVLTIKEWGEMEITCILRNKNLVSTSIFITVLLTIAKR